MDLMRTLPGSELKVVCLPLTFDRPRPRPGSDSPKLGEHNEQVFAGSRSGSPWLTPGASRFDQRVTLEPKPASSRERAVVPGN
jgi:hypothetical protein